MFGEVVLVLLMVEAIVVGAERVLRRRTTRRQKSAAGPFAIGFATFTVLAIRHQPNTTQWLAGAGSAMALFVMAMWINAISARRIDAIVAAALHADGPAAAFFASPS